MKASKSSIFRRSMVITSGTLVVLTLVAWSPPAGENVLVNPGSVQVRNGIVEAWPVGGTANVSGTAPALIVGSANNLVRGGTANELGRGIVIGTLNVLSCPSSTYSAVIGNSNNAVATNSVVIGYGNSVSYNPANPVSDINIQNSTHYSLITGQSNVIGYNGDSLIVGGKQNTVSAAHSLVTGWSNTVEGATVGSTTYYSAAIGFLNHVNSAAGWTMGYGNTVTGSLGVAIGCGLTQSANQSTALGRFNATMQSNDVLVVGTGADANNKNTALRVTSDGGVILGRAQGDISMGSYQ